MKDTSICKKFLTLFKKIFQIMKKVEQRQIDFHNTLTSDDDLHFGLWLSVVPIIKTEYFSK